MWKNIKARIFAKRYDFMKDEINPKRRNDTIGSGYFIYKDTIYFGNRFTMFISSVANDYKNYK